jgi:hypothetical protein
MSGFPTSLPTTPEPLSFTENAPEITTSLASSIEPTYDTPDDFATSRWAAPKFFTDLSAFNISHFAAGRDNLAVVAGMNLDLEDTVQVDDSPSGTLWTNASVMLQLFYPKDSINPAGRPQGGSEFYAAPLDISKASNVTFEYEVFFPSDFDWVKGGKLPGLYGGHTGCSGGDPALDCFSTRLMWRAGGAGELYLVCLVPSLRLPVLMRFSVLVRTKGSPNSLFMQRAAPVRMRCRLWALYRPRIFRVFRGCMDPR